MRASAPVLLLLLTVARLAACSTPERARDPVDPSVDAVTPSSGPRTGGTVVRLEGDGFGTEPFVTLGRSNVTEFLLVTDDAIEFVAPAGEVGAANLTVVTAEGGRRTLLEAWFYLPLPARAWEGRWFADAADASGANPVVVTSNESITTLDVELPPAATGTLAGEITGPDGAPLAGCTVVAQRADGAYAPVAHVSGLDGGFSIEGLPPGDWIVTTAAKADAGAADQAWPDAFDPVDATPVTVVAGETTSDIDFALPPAGRIGGTVTADGTPLEGATLYAVPVPSNALQFAFSTSAEDGSFLLPGLAAGDYRVVAFAFGTGRVNEYWEDALAPELASPVPVSAGNEVTLPIELDEGGELAGAVTEDANPPAALPQVLIVARDLDRGLQYTTAAGVDGTWRLGGLPPGNYRVEAPELGQFYPLSADTAGAATLAIAAGDLVDQVDFFGRLGATPCGDPGGTGTVSGEVLGPGGAKVLRADVRLQPIAGGSLATAVSGQDGRWTAACVVPGDYYALVLVPGSDLVAQYWSSTGDGVPSVVSVGAGSATGGIDVTLGRGARLGGQVRDAGTHAPLAGVPVRATNSSTGESRLTTTGPDGRWTVDRATLGGLSPGSWTVQVRPHVQGEWSPYE